MRQVVRRGGFWVLVCLLSLPGAAGVAQSSSVPTFTREQAAEGRAAYRENCASCHGAQLEGMHLSPSLTGSRFDRMWRGKTADTLFFHLRRMPQQPEGEPGSLSDETYAGILAYLLMSNGLEPSDTPLPSDADGLGAVMIPALPGATADIDAPVPGAAERSDALQNLPAVTGAMLNNPASEDWLQWGRTYSGQSYSPLDQINRETVANLKTAWRAPLRFGISMPTPVVHQGIMYLQTFPDTVLALDATTGIVLWRHQREMSTGSSQKMGLGLHGDRVLVPTSDLHVVALDAKTGEAVWDHEIKPETAPEFRLRYQLRSAPFVVGDKVIQGVTASFVPRGGFIVALDLETGEEVWRFNTIARPGEPGGNTWNGLELDERSGGSVWHQGTYDPELNLIYYGIAPTYDTGPLLHPDDDESTSNEALYTNCTIALNPDTGELVWHYQHVANDQWDLDWAFERPIVELDVNGETRKIVYTVGKMAILEALDAATGEYLFSIDSGVQNVITAIDPETGEKTIDPEKLPDPNRPCVVCPSAFGARSWPPTAYSPKTELVYIPITEWCMELGPEGFQLLTSGVGISSKPHPDTDDGMIGRLLAVNIRDRAIAWNRDLKTPPSTSVLATAGGVVFCGDTDPALKAFDDTTGELLWQAELDADPSSTLATYSVDGKQYVAVVAGVTNLHLRELVRAYAELTTGETSPPLSSPAPSFASIWVFAL